MRLANTRILYGVQEYTQLKFEHSRGCVHVQYVPPRIDHNMVR